MANYLLFIFTSQIDFQRTMHIEVD